jgi:broad specificity phosphatase PhoE
VRHGQSAGNIARDRAEASGAEMIELEHRDADVPLSDLGERQAKALATWVASLPEHEHPTVLLTSPYARARQTCAALEAAIGLDAGMVVDERLREKEFGVLDRYTRHGITAKFPDLAAQRALVGKFYFRPPGGESWCDVVLRLRSVLSDLQRNYVGERVVIVGHQVIVSCFRYLAEHLDERAILDIDKAGEVPNCGITEYLYDADSHGLRLGRVNLVQPVASSGEQVTHEPDQPHGAR